MGKGLQERVLENSPYFAEEVIEPLTVEVLENIRKFSVEEYWRAHGSINIFDVVGTRHPDYMGKTWLWLLQNGKRMSLNQTLFEQNPGYYLGQDKKEPTMSYIRLNGKLYVDRDGNHRSCIARFFFTENGITQLHGVEVMEYRVDGGARARLDALSKALDQKNMRYITRDLYREKTVREDDEGWMKERFDLKLKLRNIKYGSQLVLDRGEWSGFQEAVEGMSLFKKLFGGNDKYTKFLSGRGGVR